MATRSSDGKSTGRNLWISVAVLLVAAAFLLPAYGVFFGPMQMAKRMAAWSNLRSITNLYQPYAIGNGSFAFRPKAGDNAHDMALILAQDPAVREPFLWLMKDDKANAGLTVPGSIFVNGPASEKMNPDFAKLTLAYEFAANIPAKLSTNNIPIAWTRGLQPDGTWSADSPWGGAGGFVAYLDGRIVWIDNKIGLEYNGDNPPLFKFGTNTPTVNFREALPPDAVILSAAPVAK